MKYELPSTELIVIEENNYLKFGEYLNDMQCDDTTNKLCLDDLEYVKKLQQDNQQLKDKLSKIETLIINHNCDTGDIYYKYNSKFVKSELKQRILEIVYEERSDE